MQDANQVVAVMRQIAACDFKTGLYANTTGTKGDIAWIGYAAHGPQRRYFEVMVEGVSNPLICLISRAESDKSIDRVHPGKSTELVSVDDLTKDGFSGVLRGLGLYRVLAACGNLKLSDFKSVRWTHMKYPEGHFAAITCFIDTLEPSGVIHAGGLHTRAAATAAAEAWFEVGGDDRFAVVIDHQGNAVAAYYRGNPIAT